MGSNTPATLDGVEYQKDRFSTGGQSNATPDPIAGVDEDALYQSERYGTLTYDVPVTNATYSVVLHFVEMYQTAAGTRTFNATVEGQSAASNLDIFSEVGHDTALTRIVSNVQVSDGTLTIELDSVVENATLSGFAIYSADGGQFIEPPAPTICPASGPCKILPLGDSITDGVGFSGGYRVELFRKAINAGKDITFVGNSNNGPNTVDGRSFPTNHEGHSGWSIDEIAGIVPNPALNGDPDIILLMIGTNDTWKDEGNTDPASMQRKLGNLVDKIVNNQPDALLVVALITPRYDYAEGFVAPYNNIIPQVVQQRADMGFNIILGDQFNGFPRSGMQSDNLHPNESGYNWMAGRWFEAIESYLP